MTNHTARQEVMNMIHEMEPEDAIQIARSIIDTVGARAVIWVADDIDTVLDDYHSEADLTDEEREKIKDSVLSSYEWRTLEDASNNDWDKINTAVWAAAWDHGIHLKRNDG